MTTDRQSANNSLGRVEWEVVSRSRTGARRHMAQFARVTPRRTRRARRGQRTERGIPSSCSSCPSWCHPLSSSAPREVVSRPSEWHVPDAFGKGVVFAFLTTPFEDSGTCHPTARLCRAESPQNPCSSVSIRGSPSLDPNRQASHWQLVIPGMNEASSLDAIIHPVHPRYIACRRNPAYSS
ncbi:MAG: hypothetical protein JWP89_6340 [Schlesneria sp.]|nr:hypothetical protein [Schlesneria sp.]